MSARLLLAGAALSLALSCSRSVDVFEDPVRVPVLIDATVRDPDDGLVARPSPCGACEAPRLCVIDRCVPRAGITSVAAWMDATYALRDGRLFAWGNNEDGQLGLGDRESRDRPARVGAFNDWLALGPGELSVCALRAPGSLYCWGSGEAGQLGLGDTKSELLPVRVGEREDWAQVRCGGESCCAIDAARRLFCWGENLEGKPGQQDPYGSPDVLEPTEVAGGGTFERVAVGQGHVCAIRRNGELLCWGRNTEGALGLGTEQLQVRELSRVGEFNDWVDVDASQHHTCAVRSNGELHCWGKNEFFELTQASPELARSPKRVGTDSDWSRVATGWFHTCGLKNDGSLHCWGRAIEGQLGQGGGADPEPAPVLVELPGVAVLTTGHFSTCAIDEPGDLYCWGINPAGQLGVGDTERRFEPAPVAW